MPCHRSRWLATGIKRLILITSERTRTGDTKCLNQKNYHPRKSWSAISRPKLAELTDDVLFGDVWERAELSKRDRSLVTVAALIANGNTEQLTGHLKRAKDNGLSETELAEVIIHLAFYAGWPRAMSAVKVAREVFKK